MLYSALSNGGQEKEQETEMNQAEMAALAQRLQDLAHEARNAACDACEYEKQMDNINTAARLLQDAELFFRREANA